MTGVVSAADARRSRRFAAGLLLAILAINFIFMPREVWRGDPQVWRLEASTLLQKGRLWIDPGIVATALGEPGQYYDFNPVDGHYYSKYGIANTIVAIPPLAVEIWMSHFHPVTEAQTAAILNLYQIFFDLLTAAVLFQITGRYTADPWKRVFFVLACFYCTFLWYYQRAQGAEIYQLLFFLLAYEFLLRGLARPRWLWASWLFIGLLVLTRVFFGVLIPVFGLFILIDTILRRRPLRTVLAPLVVAPAVILLILGWINNLKFGSPFLTGYHQWRPEEHMLTGSLLDGVYGLLFSGHWSIFTYFPVLLIALPGMRKFASEHRLDFLLIGIIFLTTILTLGKIPSWRGEWTYGPRYMLFLLPIASLPALSLEIGKPKVWWYIAAAGLLFSLWLQTEVNGADFWFFYQVQQPLDKLMDKETAQYFYDHPEGFLVYDLRRHRDDLDDSFLMRDLAGRSTPLPREHYRALLTRDIDITNYYWWQ